jgi:hypothetical protein
MDNSKTLKIILIFVLLAVVVNFAFNLFTVSQIRSVKTDIKAARENISKATESLISARSSVDSLQLLMQKAQSDLNVLNRQVDNLNVVMKSRIGQIDRNIDNLLKDMRKRHDELIKLQNELLKLQE